MLVGDSVLLQKGNKIFRPSDIGKSVELAGTWTLRFNNGTSITTTGETLFKQCRDTEREEWISLDNMSRHTTFGYRTPFDYYDDKWDSKVELSDYTNNSGKFDLNNKSFAKFAGFFIRGAKTLAKRPNAYVLDKKKFGDLIDYVKELYPKGTVDEDKSYYILSKCWVDELLDVLFNFTDVVSIPDELMFKVSEEWIEALGDGFFTAGTYDASKDCYRAQMKYSQFLTDYGVLTMRIGKGFQVSQRRDETSDMENFVIKFPRYMPPLSIIDGFENHTPQLLYDVGSGEFNASGIMIKG